VSAGRELGVVCGGLKKKTEGITLLAPGPVQRTNMESIAPYILVIEQASRVYGGFRQNLSVGLQGGCLTDG